MASKETVELFGKLEAQKNSHSLLKTHLKKEIFEKLKEKKTKFNGTLADCIRSGALNEKSGVGVYASDPDAYKVFEDLLFPVIKEYHKVAEVKHPKPDFGKLDKLPFGDLDPKNEFVVSTRVRVGRSHASFGFPPVISKEDCIKMEEAMVAAFKKLPDDLAGTYTSLQTMTKADQDQLVADHFLFKDDDPMLRDAGGYNHWPAGRGIFFSKDKKFLVWVNEEDHMRFISMDKGGDLLGVYTRLARACDSLAKSGLTFATHPKLGYLTFCPSNLGTAMRASVHIKVPKVSALPEFNKICEEHDLQPRGIHGEHTESVGGVFDISNKRRLGLTELEAATQMYNGIKKIIDMEKKL